MRHGDLVMAVIIAAARHQKPQVVDYAKLVTVRIDEREIHCNSDFRAVVLVITLDTENNCDGVTG